MHLTQSNKLSNTDIILFEKWRRKYSILICTLPFAVCVYLETCLFQIHETMCKSFDS